MKKLIHVFFVFFPLHCAAGLFFHEAILTYHDGTVVEGLATMVSRPGENIIRYKSERGEKAEQILSTELKNIFYVQKGIEMERVQAYSLLNSNKIKDPVWMQVAVRGCVTLYFTERLIILSGDNDSGRSHRISYYCIRPGETAATIIARLGNDDNEAFFRSRASDYFADNPKLVSLIREGVYFPGNIEAMVRDYNSVVSRK